MSTIGNCCRLANKMHFNSFKLKRQAELSEAIEQIEFSTRGYNNNLINLLN